MSSPQKGSLSELAELATYVEKHLMGNLKILQFEEIETLRGKINTLQANCPNYDGVVAARVLWFELLLDHFESEVAIPSEERRPLASPESEVSTTVGHINHFLRRSYLKDSFPRLYKRTHSLYSRLVSVERPVTGDRSYWLAMVNRLEEQLLDGRL